MGLRFFLLFLLSLLFSTFFYFWIGSTYAYGEVDLAPKV